MSRELLWHADDTDATDCRRFFNVSLTAHRSQLITSKQITKKNIMNMKTFKNHPVVKFLRIILHIISLCLFTYLFYSSIQNQSPMWNKVMGAFLIVCALIDLYLDRHLFLCTRRRMTCVEK